MAKVQEANVETETAETPPAEGAPAEETPQREKTVPHAALHEERLRRKEAEKQVREANERFSMLEGRLEELRRAAEPKATDVPADPIRDLEEIKAWKKDTEEKLRGAEQEARAFNDFNNAVVTQIDEFRGEHNDYDTAIEFLAAERDAQLKEIGWDDPAQRLEVMKREANAIYAKALQDGVNPGSRVYALAKRMGYKPEEAAKPNGAGATAGERLRTIAAGQGAARSLSNAAGSATKPLTLQALADMPRDEFRKVSQDKALWRKLMTGQG